jgi:O-antigen/teichoic acid export membrane protein
MSRTRRILGGASIGYAHQAAIILVGIWLTPFLLHRIGQHEYGLWLVAGQLLGYLALLDLGVLAILPREVATVSGQAGIGGADDRIAGLVAQVRRIVRWQLPGLAVACALVWWFLPTEWLTLRWPLTLVFVAFIVLYPLRIGSAVLQGLQDLAFLGKTQVVAWTLGTGVTLALILAGTGLYALVIGWIVTLAVPALAAWWRVRSRWPRTLSGNGRAPVRQYFHRSVWVSAGQIAQVLLAGSDVLLLGTILGPAAVVPYACTGKLVTVFANHPHLLMHVAQPALTELRASESRGRLGAVATALTQAMLMMSGALLVAIVCVNQFFVSWWVGPNQYSGWWLTIAFAAMMWLRHWNVATVYTLFCFGYERQLALTGLADGIVTAVGTGLCVWKWGLIGAPIASMIGVVTVSLPINVRSVAHEMGLPLRAFLTSIAPLFVRIVGIAAVTAVASIWIGGRSLAAVVVLLISTGTLYFAAILPLAWHGPVGPYLRMAWPMITGIDKSAADAAARSRPLAALDGGVVLETKVG